MTRVYRLLLIACLTTAPCTAYAQEAAIPVRRVFGPEDPGGRYKHPASLTQLANGDLYLAFYGGSGEYATDTAVYGARQKPERPSGRRRL